MQALQSRSLARLERAVIPIAENINSIHNRVGDVGDKIDDLHRIIMSVANSTPSLVARDRALGEDIRNVSPIGGSGSISALESGPSGSSQLLLETSPRQSSSFAPVLQTSQPERTPHDSVQSTPITIHRQRKGDERRTSSMDWDFENGSPPVGRGSIGNSIGDVAQSEAGASQLDSTSPGSSRRESTLVRRESSTLPTFFRTISEESAGSEDAHRLHYRHRSYDANVSPISEGASETWRTSQPVLPPPAIPPSPTLPQAPATPSSFFSQAQRSRSESNVYGAQSRPQTAKSVKADSPISPALTTLPLFEKSLFRNAAILCDVRATLVEYAQHLPDEPDPRYNTEMVETCKEARICVIRKRENRAHGGTRLATSIWTLSNDGVVRCQQKLSEIADTVPYCSYFQPEKVSLAEHEMRLRFHGQHWTDMPDKDIKTNWINYIFATENDAVAFQSAVFGRMLIGSFRTTKTIVIHQGIKGAFAFEEQFANIEVLRLWEDDGVATPGAQGGIMALLHVSSNFGEGWAKWWINSSKQQVRVKGEGLKNARLKGLDITVVKPSGTGVSTAEKIRHPGSGSPTLLQRVDTKDSLNAPQVPMKKIPVKRVTGIKIEFKEEEERLRFVEASQQLQEKMLPLPDL